MHEALTHASQVRLSIIATTALRSRGISPPPSPLHKAYYTPPRAVDAPRQGRQDVPPFSLESAGGQPTAAGAHTQCTELM